MKDWDLVYDPTVAETVNEVLAMTLAVSKVIKPDDEIETPAVTGLTLYP